MMMRRAFGVLVMVIAPITMASGQSAAAPTALPAATNPVPDSFQGITLGMELDAVKNALKGNALFNYRGDPDVSMLPSPNENLIETAGYSYITRAFFQFYDKKLYTMIFMLDPTELSYYTMYTTLEAKYGAPVSLSPDAVVWESSTVRLSLERPLSVKYIDLGVFDKLDSIMSDLPSGVKLTKSCNGEAAYWANY